MRNESQQIETIEIRSFHHIAPQLISEGNYEARFNSQIYLCYKDFQPVDSGGRHALSLIY